MSLFGITAAIFMLCFYIAIIVKEILKNQSRFNDARYEQIKKLQNDVEKLNAEIKRIKE